MEDMESKLNAMLNDPAAMQRIIQMAQQLSGGAAQPHTPPPPPPPRRVLLLCRRGVYQLKRGKTLEGERVLLKE